MLQRKTNRMSFTIYKIKSITKKSLSIFNVLTFSKWNYESRWYRNKIKNVGSKLAFNCNVRIPQVDRAIRISDEYVCQSDVRFPFCYRSLNVGRFQFPIPFSRVSLHSYRLYRLHFEFKKLLPYLLTGNSFKMGVL